MKRIQIELSEKDYVFMIELLRHLGFEYSEEEDIPEEHKAIVRYRMKYVRDGELNSWQEALSTFRFKE
jgi:hypothetical protein